MSFVQLVRFVLITVYTVFTKVSREILNRIFRQSKALLKPNQQFETSECKIYHT